MRCHRTAPSRDPADGRYPCADCHGHVGTSCWNAGCRAVYVGELRLGPHLPPVDHLPRTEQANCSISRAGQRSPKVVFGLSVVRVSHTGCRLYEKPVVRGSPLVLAYRFGRTTRDNSLATLSSVVLPPPWGSATDLTLQIVVQPQVKDQLAESRFDSATVPSTWCCRAAIARCRLLAIAPWEK